MNINCPCGASIPDVTDYQENKAYLLPDQQWETTLESIESGESPWNATLQVRRVVLQCYECGRLHVQNKDGEFVSFKPDNDIKFGILSGT